jgi:hypothetical protein
MQNDEQTKYMLDIIQILLHRIKEKEDAIANFEKQNARLKEMITNVLSNKERKNSGAKADAVQYAYEEDYTPQVDKYMSLPPLSTKKILSTKHFSPPQLFIGSPAERHNEDGHPNDTKVFPLHISTKKTPSKRHLTVNTPRGYSLYEHTLNKRASSVCSPKRDYDEWLGQYDRNLLPLGPCTQ